MVLIILMAVVLLWRGIEAVRFLGGLWIAQRLFSCTFTNTIGR